MSVNIQDLPNEIIVEILRHLDVKSLYEAGHVCIRWESIVQVLHNKAWRKVSKVAMFNESVRIKYEAKGWIKEAHSWNQCQCLNIEMECYCYDNLEQLSEDLDVSSSIIIEHDYEYGYCELRSLEQVEAAARLASAGLWCSTLDELVIEHVDLTPSVQNLKDLIKVTKKLLLLYVRSNDFSKIFKYIKGDLFVFYHHLPGILNEAEKMSLVDVLNYSVAEFEFDPVTQKPFSLIKKYNGMGKCCNIYFRIEDEEEEDIKQSKEEAKEWANSVGWSIDIDNGYFIMKRTVLAPIWKYLNTIRKIFS